MIFLVYHWHFVLLHLQRVSIGQSLPWFWDSVLSIGVVLHGICNSKPEFSFYFVPIRSWEIRLSFAYLFAGYFSYILALALAPYGVFNAMAAIGAVSLAFRVIERKNRNNGEAYNRNRKHSHRHWVSSYRNGGISFFLARCIKHRKLSLRCCTNVYFLGLWWNFDRKFNSLAFLSSL